MSGPYRFLRHPMYAGELLSLTGVLTAFPGLQNMFVFIIFFTSILWRIHQEEKLLGRNGYRHYAEHVKWRLVPGVW
jgi:protein-S-isoprenylcysteine O-methyltransferase Ste14